MSQKKIKFGKIKQYILFGGGDLLFFFAFYLKKFGKKVQVITSQRHADECLNVDEKRSLSFSLKTEEINFYVSKDINRDKKLKEMIAPGTLGISFGAAWIFRKDIIEKFDERLINVHGTPLPRFRGGGGFSWNLLLKDNSGCSTIHAVDEGIDTGPIVKMSPFSYPDTCRFPRDFREVYIKKTMEFLKEFVAELDQGKEFPLVLQRDEESTYWPRLNTDIHGFINWDWTLEEIDCFIHAFGYPYKGASTFVNDQRVYVTDCFKRSEQKFHPFQDGLVYRKKEGSLFVAKREGTLIVTGLIDEQRKNIMPQINLGDRFYTPRIYLDKAMTARAQYSPEGLTRPKKRKNPADKKG